MTDNHLLLTDTQMQHFLQHGYLTLKTRLPAEFHQEIYRRTEEVFAKEGNPGNNILPRIPELHQVFADPVLSGGLASLLGPSYLMHSHRHCHINPAGSKGGGWHKDSYWGFHKVRSHRTRWVMIFYYPQDTTLDNGPTAVMPGTQCYEQRAASEADEVHLSVCGEAGTATLVHFDLWHRATANQTANNRYMMKFQFARMEEPTAPCWNRGAQDWQSGVVGAQLWQWHLGGRGSQPVEVGEAVPALAAALRDSAEPVRLKAAYALGAAGNPGVPALAEALGCPAKEIQLGAAYGLAVAGRAAVPALTEALDHPDEQTRGCAAFALGDMGAQAGEAVGRLARLGRDPSPFVRRHVAEALGTIARHPEAAVPALEGLLADEDPQTRFNAAYALARFGTQAEAAVPALALALEDSNRYVRNHSAEALRHIGTPRAQQALMDFLLVSRWCPITTKESTF